MNVIKKLAKTVMSKLKNDTENADNANKKDYTDVGKPINETNENKNDSANNVNEVSPTPVNEKEVLSNGNEAEKTPPYQAPPTYADITNVNKEKITPSTTTDSSTIEEANTSTTSQQPNENTTYPSQKHDESTTISQTSPDESTIYPSQKHNENTMTSQTQPAENAQIAPNYNLPLYPGKDSMNTNKSYDVPKLSYNIPKFSVSTTPVSNKNRVADNGLTAIVTHPPTAPTLTPINTPKPLDGLEPPASETSITSPVPFYENHIFIVTLSAFALIAASIFFFNYYKKKIYAHVYRSDGCNSSLWSVLKDKFFSSSPFSKKDKNRIEISFDDAINPNKKHSNIANRNPPTLSSHKQFDGVTYEIEQLPAQETLDHNRIVKIDDFTLEQPQAISFVYEDDPRPPKFSSKDRDDLRYPSIISDTIKSPPIPQNPNNIDMSHDRRIKSHLGIRTIDRNNKFDSFITNESSEFFNHQKKRALNFESTKNNNTSNIPANILRKPLKRTPSMNTDNSNSIYSNI